MANAAAKKAKAARSSASSTYLPLVLGLNVFHLLLRLYSWDSFATFRNLSLHAVLLGLTAFAYRGILDGHADSSGRGRGRDGDVALAGGASLDLLGLVVVVQFGSALISDGFYWLVTILPFWGAYTAWKMFKGAREGMMGNGGRGGAGGTVAGNPGADAGGEVDEATAERRRKRSERRRMKRS